MWAWQNLFLETPKEDEVDLIKSSRLWEITKPKFATIDTNLYLSCPSNDTGTQTLDEPLDKTQSQDNLLPQDETQSQDEIKEIQAEFESEDKTKETQAQSETETKDQTEEIQAESESEDKTKETLTKYQSEDKTKETQAESKTEDQSEDIQAESISEAKAKEIQAKSKSEDKTKPPDFQPQDENQDKTKLQEDSNSQNSGKKHGWIITKEKIPPFCKDHNCLLSDLSELPRLTFGNFVVEVEMGKPGEKIQEKAKQELRETQDIVDQSIKTLKEFLKEEQLKEGLIAPLDNVAWLKKFLRPTHYYPDSAFLKVKYYYEFKIKNDKHRELFNDLKPSLLEKLFNHDILTALPLRDQNGCRIMVMEIGRKWDYNVCSLDEIYKGSIVFLETALLDNESQISGAVIIFDMEGLDSWQILHFIFNPSFTFRVVDFLQSAAPIRIKGLHVVNEPSTFGKLLRLFTVLMHEKFKNRIHIHGKDRASLHKHIDADRLPPEYGGTCEAPRISGPVWLEALSMLDKEFEALNSYGYKKKIK